MRLRPYKSCDAAAIEKWARREDTFKKWGGERFGTFPISAEIIDNKYLKDNGDCVEADNFYPWTAVDDDDRAVGHFIIRYTGGDSRQLRFGWVIVDDEMRGKGYGQQMLTLGLDLAFRILGAEKVTIGVYENNASAHRCYEKVGFTDKETVKSEPWNIIEMEILKR